MEANGKRSVQAFFKGSPGDEKDELCRAIFEEAGGDFVGCGTALDIGERDYQYDVPVGEVEALKNKLVDNGFSLTPSPDNFAWS